MFLRELGWLLASVVSAEVLLRPSASSSSVCVFHMPCRRRCWWMGEEQPKKIAFAPMATFLDKVMLLFLWLKVNRQRKDTWTFVLNCDHQ